MKRAKCPTGEGPFFHILVFPFIEHLPSTVLNDVHAMSHLILIRTLFFTIFFYFERERKRGERNINVRGLPPHAYPLGIKLAAQVCTWTGN